MFGSQRIIEALPTDIGGCNPDNISLKGCLNLYEDHPHNANLLFNIGLMYELENVNNQLAVEFYKKSAALGNHRALNNYNYLIEKN
jgi:TPR repeat protein